MDESWEKTKAWKKDLAEISLKHQNLSELELWTEVTPDYLQVLEELALTIKASLITQSKR